MDDSIKNVVMSVAASIGAVSAAIGAYVAARGLSTWRHQLAGNAEYELARRFLRAVYKVRDATKSLLAPAFTDAAWNEVLLEQQTGTRLKTKASILELRWETINERLSELQVEVLEAEALWGSQIIQDHLRPLTKCVLGLKGKIVVRLAACDQSEENPREFKIRVLLQDSDKDLFDERLKQAIEQIESFMRPQLKV